MSWPIPAACPFSTLVGLASKEASLIVFVDWIFILIVLLSCVVATVNVYNCRCATNRMFDFMLNNLTNILHTTSSKLLGVAVGLYRCGVRVFQKGDINGPTLSRRKYEKLSVCSSLPIVVNDNTKSLRMD